MFGFWGLNAGLMGMILITLLPVGILQVLESFQNGYWSARAWSFYQQPAVHTLLWMRVVPDLVFIFAGVLPLLAAVLYGFLNLRPATATEEVPATVEALEAVNR